MFESRVVCICGLPGIGSVGKVAADYLSNALKCSSIKPFYSHSFPSQVMVSDGLAELMHAELLRSQDMENIFVLSGDTQPLDVQGMYQLAGEILQAIESEGGTDVITLAAFVGDATAKILGSATDPESAAILHDSGIPLLRSGAIGGMNGLLAGLAPLYNMRGFCLLGTSSGADLIDIAAATNLLYAIRDLFKLDLDFSMMESILDEPDEPVPEEVDMNYC
jgi:hypothetical protein